MRLTLIALATLSAVSATHGINANQPPHRRHAARQTVAERNMLVGRAGGALSNETIAAMSADQASAASSQADTASTSVAVSDAASSAAAETSAAGSSGKAGDIITPSSAAAQTSAVPTSSAVPDDVQTSAAPVEQVATSDIPSAAASGAYSDVVQSPTGNAPVTLSISSATAVSSTQALKSSRTASVVTMTRTASDRVSASADAANGSSEEKKGGLSKLAMIIIIVIASVVAIGAALVFGIRKWKLRPSNRFDSRLKPIDFSPHNDGMEDVFLEKTHHRTASNASADRQRQQFVKELEADPNYVAGVPEHDFTASANHAGYGAYDETYTDTYNNDPFARAEAYEYDQDDYYHGQNAQQGYAPSAGHVEFPSHGMHAQDYPTQDQPEEGYANLQRGNSNGSDHARHAVPTAFPSADTYLGRPTGGNEGP